MPDTFYVFHTWLFPVIKPYNRHPNLSEPPLRTPSLTTLEALNQALDYDPDTGAIRWLQPRSPRIAEGATAGSINNDGAIVIGFQGRQYQAHHVAWFFHTGGWPTSQVLFHDRNPHNFAASNLYLQEHAYTDTPKARQMRRYRERLKAKKTVKVLTSTVPGVTYGADKLWHARATWAYTIVLASFTDKQSAENYATMSTVGHAYAQANPPPKLPDTAKSLWAGAENTMSLAEAHQRFAYDPAIGAIYHRWPPRREGTPAIELNPDRRPVVKAGGRAYSAGMLAWFLAHGHWPKRKQIAYRDNNPANTALANLFLRDEK